MLTTTTRNSIYSPLYRLRRRHKRRNGNGRIPRERSSRSSGEVWRIEKQYPGFVAEIDIEKIMGEIKRAARRNPSDFSSQANSKQTCLQNLVFACIFLKYVSIFYNTGKTGKALKNKEKPAIRWDCGLPCFGARGETCPPCAAAGRGSGAPPALHSLPLPFKSRGSKRK